MESTPELIEAGRRHDRRALEELLVLRLTPLEAFVRLRMGPILRARLTAPDLVQSVCREVLEDLSEFEYRGDGQFRHWLYTRALNKLLEKQRYLTAQRRDPAREISPPTDHTTFLSIYRDLVTPSRILEAKEAAEHIESAFDELPEDYREAVTLHRICGLSLPEIAERMGRTEATVRNLVYRGLSRLALRVDELLSS